ncbi:hypothetical protein JCM15765_18920 [Paradesulfitobacterium aromaticivorans]
MKWEMALPLTALIRMSALAGIKSNKTTLTKRTSNVEQALVYTVLHEDDLARAVEELSCG